MLLSDADKERFALFCEENARSVEIILKQMVEIGAPDQLVQLYRAEAAALRLVATKLQATERQEVR